MPSERHTLYLNVVKYSGLYSHRKIPFFLAPLFNSIMPSEGTPCIWTSQVLRTLFSEKDTLLPCSAIDKYSISHPDSFLQQIVNAGKVKESETEREGQLRHKFSPGRRLGAEGRSLVLSNILVLPGIPISPYSHTDTHSGPKYYTLPTFTSKATKFFPAFLSPVFQFLRKIMVKRSCYLTLLTHMSASQTHFGEGV